MDGEKQLVAPHPGFVYNGSTDQTEALEAPRPNPFITASSMMMSASQLARYTSICSSEVYETLGDLMFPKSLNGPHNGQVSSPVTVRRLPPLYLHRGYEVMWR